MNKLEKGFLDALTSAAKVATRLGVNSLVNSPRHLASQQIGIHFRSAAKALWHGQTDIAHSHVRDGISKLRDFKNGVAQIHPEVHEFMGMKTIPGVLNHPLTKTHSFRGHPTVTPHFSSRSYRRQEMQTPGISPAIRLHFSQPTQHTPAADDYGVNSNRLINFVDNMQPVEKALAAKEGQERVHFPAIKLPSGKVYTGTPTHFAAAQAALKAGEDKKMVAVSILGMHPGSSTGFSTNKRDFVDREEAYRIASAAGQLHPDVVKDHAEIAKTVPEEKYRRQLDSGDYMHPEAPSMMKSISVQHEFSRRWDHYEPGSTMHRYKLHHESGATGHLLFQINRYGDAYVHTVAMAKPGEDINSYSMGEMYRKGKNRFGPKEILGLQRQILQRHPEIKRFVSSSRITGTREGMGKTHIAHAPVTDSRRINSIYKSIRMVKTDVKKYPDGTHYSYDLYHHSGASGGLEMAINGDEAYIHDIYLHHGDHQHSSDLEEWNSGKNLFGPKEILGLHRDIMARHPEIKRFAGYRLTGARGEADNPSETHLSIPAKRLAPSMAKALTYSHDSDRTATRLAMQYFARNLQSNPEALKDVAGQGKVMTPREYGVGSLGLKPQPFSKLAEVAKEIMLRTANHAIARAQGIDLENKDNSPTTTTTNLVTYAG